MLANKRIACWMSEKKSQKLKWSELEQTFKRKGFELFKLDLDKSLESQGSFSVLLHKLTDIIAMSNQGDKKSENVIHLVEKYLSSHPEVLVIDPIPNVRQLLDRYRSYSIIEATDLYKYKVFTPSFCEMKFANIEKTVEQLRQANVQYPFICKPLLGHGSRKAHEMMIIFNERNLEDCKPPCVAQTFINHNAVLYKIFIIGDQHYYVERPSLKNFYACDRDTIFFDSGEVSKASAHSSLTVLDVEEQLVKQIKPDPEILETIASTLRFAFGMDLLGVDVVIDNFTGHYAIIDVNAYPGYDGFPNFYETLVDFIASKMKSSTVSQSPNRCGIKKIEDVSYTNCNGVFKHN